jgi:hypothetical protein
VLQVVKKNIIAYERQSETMDNWALENRRSTVLRDQEPVCMTLGFMNMVCYRKLHNLKYPKSENVHQLNSS